MSQCAHGPSEGGVPAPPGFLGWFPRPCQHDAGIGLLSLKWALWGLVNTLLPTPLFSEGSWQAGGAACCPELPEGRCVALH